MENIPLPEKLRPKKLSGFIGQKHLVGKEGIIKTLLENAKRNDLPALSDDRQAARQIFFPSIIFWGPPGSGKTTLARIIANTLKREFYEFSAVNTSTKDVEKVIKETANNPLLTTHSPIIFIDEIHRFNKAQQDKLLPYVERGDIILIGATTENPSFRVIGPLMSRCRVLVLNQLTESELRLIINRGLKFLEKKADLKTKKFLIESSNGDARVALNVLEIAVSLGSGLSTRKRNTLTIELIEQALQRRQLAFDKKGEEYYNTISSYLKSMRASNVDASLYYLARMVEAGQDPLYIARRMVVFASEDVASPTALVVANAVFRACETIGYPECQENLAAGTVYLAKAKKDRSAYDAYFRALDDVKKFGNLPTPLKIRNAPTKLMKELDYGKDYEMYTNEDLLPEKLKGKKYYKKQ